MLLNFSLALAALGNLLLTCMSFFSFFHSFILWSTLLAAVFPSICPYVPIIDHADTFLLPWLLGSNIHVCLICNLSTCVHVSPFLLCIFILLESCFLSNGIHSLAIIPLCQSILLNKLFLTLLCVLLPPITFCHPIFLYVLFNIRSTYSSLYYCCIILC